MKTKLLLLIVLTTSSLTAMSEGATAICWSGPMPVVNCSFEELQAASGAIEKRKSAPRTVVTGATVLGVYGVSKLGIAQALFPALFPRSGTSTIVMYTLGGLAVSGTAWVGVSYVRSLFLLGNAHGDLQRALREMQNMKKALEELKACRAEEAEKRTAMEAKVTEAKENSRRAREAMEATQAGVEQMLANMDGALANAAHIKVVTALKNRVGDLEDLMREMTLDRLRQATADERPIDQLTAMADELATAASRFERTNDHQANQTAVQQAVTEHKKKKGWKFW